MIRVIKKHWYRNFREIIGRKIYIIFTPFGLRFDIFIRKIKYANA